MCSFQMCSTLNSFISPVFFFFSSGQPCWGEIIVNVLAVHYLIHNYTLPNPARSTRISWSLMKILPSLNSQVSRYTLLVYPWSCASVLDNTHLNDLKMTLLNLILCSKGRQLARPNSIFVCFFFFTCLFCGFVAADQTAAEKAVWRYSV